MILLVGLDNAGKSCAAKGLAREPVETVVPTVGFNAVRLTHRGYTVIIYDLGGGPQIRGIWSRYFIDVHGLIYVVDASDTSRIDESRKVLEELLASDKLAGKPVLLLANKQDKQGALDEIDIVERLNVESLVNQQRCPTLVETCSAAGGDTRIGRKRKLDPGIQNGYRWLLRRIISEYDVLNSRVLQDVAAQREAEEKQRMEWRQKYNAPMEVENCTTTELDSGDPFKPIDMLVKEVERREGIHTNGHANHIVVVKPANGHVNTDVQDTSSDHEDSNSVESTLSRDSPDTVSRSVNNSPVSNKKQTVSAFTAVREQLEWKGEKQRKKLLVRKSNRTVPLDGLPSADVKSLPPLKQVPRTCPWARPPTSRSLPTQESAWELDKTLEVVMPPRDNIKSDSDSDDVVMEKR